jgi:RNA polymerase-binding transcription factor DksA
MRYLTIEQRDDLRDKLKQRAAILRGEFAGTMSGGGYGDSGAASLPRHGEETDDDAVADLETSMDAASAERTTRELREIERALERLHSPDFGICEDCEADIPVIRLQASLTATRCIACQSRYEREHGVTGSRTL